MFVVFESKNTHVFFRPSINFTSFTFYGNFDVSTFFQAACVVYLDYYLYRDLLSL